jgi:hypothetical protein
MCGEYSVGTSEIGVEVLGNGRTVLAIVSYVVGEAVGTLRAGAAVSNGTCTGACVAKRLAKWLRVASRLSPLEARGEASLRERGSFLERRHR